MGSTFELPEGWQEALALKCEGLGRDDVHQRLVGMPLQHWSDRTTPMRFGACGWEEIEDDGGHSTYALCGETHQMTVLAQEVVYFFVCAALMGLALSDATSRRGKVVAFTPNGSRR